MFTLMEKDKPIRRRLIEGLASFVAVYAREPRAHYILMGQDFVERNSLKLLKSNGL